MAQEGGKESPGKQLGAQSKQTDGITKNRKNKQTNSSMYVNE